jgi:hypothetical protein
MGDDPKHLDAEIEQSRKEIAELQERVSRLTARRRERENMAKKIQDKAQDSVTAVKKPDVV